jgi:uncharacterized protein (DUF697 family)
MSEQVNETGTSAEVKPAEDVHPGHAPDEAKKRDEFAGHLVNRFAVWAGAAGVIPLPLVDIAAVGGLQLQMMRRLSQVYDVPFSTNRGKAVLAALVGSAIPVTSGLGFMSALKAVPVIGTVASAIMMPALSGGATYAVGKAFIHHFASGGTLLDFNPPDYREFIRSQKEMWESRPTPSPSPK